MKKKEPDIETLKGTIKALRADARDLRKIISERNDRIARQIENLGALQECIRKTDKDLVRSKREVETLEQATSNLRSEVRFYESERDDNMTYLRHGVSLLRPELLRTKPTCPCAEPRLYDDDPIDLLLTGIMDKLHAGYYSSHDLKRYHINA